MRASERQRASGQQRPACRLRLMRRLRRRRWRDRPNRPCEAQGRRDRPPPPHRADCHSARALAPAPAAGSGWDQPLHHDGHCRRHEGDQHGLHGHCPPAASASACRSPAGWRSRGGPAGRSGKTIAPYDHCGHEPQQGAGTRSTEAMASFSGPSASVAMSSAERHDGTGRHLRRSCRRADAGHDGTRLGKYRSCAVQATKTAQTGQHGRARRQADHLDPSLRAQPQLVARRWKPAVSSTRISSGPPTGAPSRRWHSAIVDRRSPVSPRSRRPPRHRSGRRRQDSCPEPPPRREPLAEAIRRARSAACRPT